MKKSRIYLIIALAVLFIVIIKYHYSIIHLNYHNSAMEMVKVGKGTVDNNMPNFYKTSKIKEFNLFSFSKNQKDRQYMDNYHIRKKIMIDTTLYEYVGYFHLHQNEKNHIVIPFFKAIKKNYTARYKIDKSWNNEEVELQGNIDIKLRAKSFGIISHKALKAMINNELRYRINQNLEDLVDPEKIKQYQEAKIDIK